MELQAVATDTLRLMKKLFGLAVFAALVKVAYGLAQKRRSVVVQPAGGPYVPAPTPKSEVGPAPSGPIPEVSPQHKKPDDLTRLTGIGPVYASRLHDLGIVNFASLQAATTATLAEQLQLSERAIADWQTQAGELGA